MSEAYRQPRTYGNWRIPRTGGLGSMTLGESLIALTLAGVGTVIYFMAPLGYTVVYLLVSLGFMAALTMKDLHGLSIIDKTVVRVRFMRAKFSGANIFRGGFLTPGRKNTLHLPGVLGSSNLSEAYDSYERPFAVVHHGDGSLAVVMSISAVGTDLVDQDAIDNSVALWGQWLADLGTERGLVGASVTVESVPDSGDKLRREVAYQVSPEAPIVARRLLDNIVAEYREGVARTRTYATLVFNPAEMGARGKTDRAIRDIASRLPGLSSALQATGIGAVHLMTAQEVTRMTAIAFDPALEPVFEAADAAGEEVSLQWGQAAPGGAVASWDSYQHDSGVSRSWFVTAPPRGVVQSHILRSVLNPSRDIERKRMTILYKTIDAAKAPSLVEKDLAHAQARVAMQQQATQRSIHERAAAERVASDEASGAGLVDFGLVITLTTTAEDLVDSGNALESLSAASKLQTRIAYGAQDSAFALALPLGVRPQSQVVGAKW